MTPVAAYICDDDKVFLDHLQDVFKEREVHDCLYFYNPFDLLRAIKKDSYIFVIDQRMSGVDGLSILRRIVSLNTHALVIMLSMQDDVEITSEFYLSKGWRYISKAGQDASINEAATWVKIAQARVKEMIALNQDVKKTIEWVRKKY